MTEKYIFSKNILLFTILLVSLLDLTCHSQAATSRHREEASWEMARVAVKTSRKRGKTSFQPNGRVSSVAHKTVSARERERKKAETNEQKKKGGFSRRYVRTCLDEG